MAALRLRYENNSVPETTAAPNNLDFDKYEVGAASRVLLSKRLSLVAMYSHYFIGDRMVDESLHQPTAEPTQDAINHPSPVGRYSATSDYLALYLSAMF